MLFVASGCAQQSVESPLSCDASAFARLEEEERFLAARALRLGRSEPPLREWLGVYLREPSERVAIELEHVLECVLKGPLSAALVREASAGTPLSSLAARRLLSDPRAAVRLCGVRALAAGRTPEDIGFLKEVLARPGDFGLRTAVAEALCEAGEASYVSRWCRGAPRGDAAETLVASWVSSRLGEHWGGPSARDSSGNAGGEGAAGVAKEGGGAW